MRGDWLPLSIQRDLQRAGALVLIATAGAITSAFVRLELELFLATGRPVLLIDVGRQLASADLTQSPWRAVLGVYPQPESAATVAAGRPSDAVIRFIVDSCTFTRQARRLRLAIAGTVAFVVAGIGATYASVKCPGCEGKRSGCSRSTGHC